MLASPSVLRFTIMEGNNLTSYFGKWWYGEAYGRVLKYLKAAYIFSFDLFSVSICIKTLFAPWKRDEISYEGLSLQQKFQVWTLNLASRFIGFMIKSTAIVSYLVFALVLSVFEFVVVVVWLAYPIIIIFLLYRACSSL